MRTREWTLCKNIRLSMSSLDPWTLVAATVYGKLRLWQDHGKVYEEDHEENGNTKMVV